MRSRRLSVFAGISIALGCAVAEAQDPLAVYRFNTGPHLAVTTNALGLTASPVSLSSGSFNASETNVTTGGDFPDPPFIEESGWTASSQASAKAFLITLTPDVGKSITVTGLSFNALALGSGPSAISYDVAGLAAGTINATNVVLISTNFVFAGVTDQSGAVLIKIQGWTNGTRSTSGAGAFRLDDVVIQGVVQVIPTNLQFQGSAASVSESAVAYTVTVSKTVSDGNLSAEIALGGTATLGADYTIDTTNLVLNGATTSATVVVTVTDDGNFEGPETLTLALTNVIGGGLLSPSTFTLNISDADVLAVYRFNTGPHLNATSNAVGVTASPVSLSAGSFSASETNVTTAVGFPDAPYIEEETGWTNSSQVGAKNFRFTLTPAANKSITVTGVEFKAHSSAMGPSAFSCDVAGFVSGTANATNAVVQTNRFAISGVTNQNGAVLIQVQGWTNGSRSTTGGGVFKLDDVLVYGVVGSVPTNLQFVGSAASASESSISCTVTVSKTVSEGNVSAQIALGGAATLGADYTVDTTNLVLNGATTSATVVVTVYDDAIVEGAESVVLTLTNVVGGGLLSPSTFTLTIDDPGVLAAYRFNAGPHLVATTNAAGLAASPVSLSSGSFNANETNVTTGGDFPDPPFIEESGWTASSQASAKAFLITLTPDAGKSITVTGLSFNALALGSGPSAISYDVAGLAAGTINATNAVLISTNFVFAGVTDQSGAVLIKIQGWTNGTRSTSGAGAFRLDDVLVYGFVQSTGGGSPTNVHFFASGAVVGEEQGVMNVTVYKTVAEGSVTAELQLGGSAALGVDYSVDTTNIVLNGATTSQTVVVTITDDLDLEPTEAVVISLANVSGGTAISPDVFTLSITNNDLADADGDLMPDAWEQDNFGGSTTNGAAGDPDSDGFSNLAEYIAGTQPTNGLSYLKLAGITAAAGANVSFIGVTGRLYRLAYSESLLNESGWTEFTNSIPGTNGLMWVPHSAPVTNRGYRVSVQLP